MVQILFLTVQYLVFFFLEVARSCEKQNPVQSLLINNPHTVICKFNTVTVIQTVA